MGGVLKGCHFLFNFAFQGSNIHPLTLNVGCLASKLYLGTVKTSMQICMLVT
jgi:hypothetical protein